MLATIPPCLSTFIAVTIAFRENAPPSIVRIHGTTNPKSYAAAGENVTARSTPAGRWAGSLTARTRSARIGKKRKLLQLHGKSLAPGNRTPLLHLLRRSRRLRFLNGASPLMMQRRFFLPCVRETG